VEGADWDECYGMRMSTNPEYVGTGDSTCGGEVVYTIPEIKVLLCSEHSRNLKGRGELPGCEGCELMVFDFIEIHPIHLNPPRPFSTLYGKHGTLRLRLRQITDVVCPLLASLAS